MRRITLEHVRALTGFSTATISRVMNNRKNVSPETRARVLQAFRTLGLALPAETVVGLIVPWLSNPRAGELAMAFEREFEGRGVQVLVASSELRADREMRLIDQFRTLGARGVVLYAGRSRQDEALLAVLADSRLPAVVYQGRTNAGNVDVVGVDDLLALHRSLEHLMVWGHHRICYLKGPEWTWTGKSRYKAYLEAMSHLGLEVVREWILDGDYTLQSGRECARLLVEDLPRDHQPTAVLGANDLMTIGFMQHIQELGWRVPADISVIGFDGLEWCQWVYPALTTVAQPTELMVQTSAHLLMRRIEEVHEGDGLLHRPAGEELFAPTLVQRASVGRPRED